MTPRTADAYLAPADLKRLYPTSVKLPAANDRTRADVPIRAQSVCLKERPRSQYGRPAKSADLSARGHGQKQFYPGSSEPRPSTSYRKSSQIPVKPKYRKTNTFKIPCAVSVQNLSIPMKFADETANSKYSTFTRQRSHLCTDTSKPNALCLPTQVNKKSCRAEARGSETENRLLVQISEAEQVADFERILNSNAILSERAHGNVWRQPPSDSRPRSGYSLRAVSDAYHYLYHRHREALKPLIDGYRQLSDQSACFREPPQSILGRAWYNDLQDLSEFYDEDKTLQEEIQVIEDQIVTDEVRAADEQDRSNPGNKNFNLNLTSLIGLHVTGEGVPPLSDRDESGPSSEIEPCLEDRALQTGQEWLASSMSSDESRQNSHEDPEVDNLAQTFSSVVVQEDANLPAITLSNCCDNYTRSDRPNNSSLTIHLTVPSIQTIDESRPPIMR